MTTSRHISRRPRGLDWALDANTASGLRYATSKRNTTVSFLRLGQLVDDTWRVTVYRDGVPASFTTHGESAARILDGLVADGFDRFDQKANGAIVHVWKVG